MYVFFDWDLKSKLRFRVYLVRRGNGDRNVDLTTADNEEVAIRTPVKIDGLND